MAQMEALFAPLKLGGITLNNRITMSAMTRDRAENTYPTDLMKKYYVERAGTGLIVSEGILISRQGTEWPNAPGLWDDKHVAGWKNIVDGVHQAGGKMYAQLWHTGRVSHPDASEQKLAGMPVWAPSAISARGGKFRHIPGAPGYVTPTAVDDPDILIDQYKHAALNAKKAGFDGVELHGANGYLVTQFLDSNSNQRTDKWGGSVENRARFGLEVLKSLTEIFGDNVSVKLSPCGGYNDVGMPYQDTIDQYSYFINEAEKLNLSYFTLMRYAEALDVVIGGKHRATKIDVIKEFRPLIKRAKCILNAGVMPEEGTQLVSEGKIDAIAIAFNYVAHPDLADRVQRGLPLDNTPDIKHLYGGPEVDEWPVGYINYPKAIPVKN